MKFNYKDFMAEFVGKTRVVKKKKIKKISLVEKLKNDIKNSDVMWLIDDILNEKKNGEA